MDRRNKTRHNLQLLCVAGAGTAYSAPLEGITENISRDGILLRWLDAVPLPEIGSPLTVEVALPGNLDFGKRVMCCATTVMRITRRQDGCRSVGLHIDKVRFRAVAANTAPGNDAPGNDAPDLASMKPLSDKVS